MEHEYNSGLLYSDKVFCPRCGRPLKEQMANLELEPDYSAHHKGRCRRCKNGYDIINKIFQGADGERWMGTFDSTGAMVTVSGVLSCNGVFDPELIARENRAKNFKLHIAVDKEKEVQTIIHN